MNEYAVSFKRAARKELSSLDKSTASRIFRQIEILAYEPRPTGCRKLRGANDLWRIRIGNYRVIYRIVDQKLIIEIVTVRHRRDAYRF